MGTTTTNYGLFKPGLTDPADITAMNANWDTIDTKLKSTQQNADEAKAAALGASGKRVNRFVIATSRSGWTAKDCDYLCDGTSDNVEINNAINALPSTGGEIILLDGVYNLSSPINLGIANSILRGNGANTKLVRAFSGSVDNDSMILITASNCIVRDVQLDGVKTTYSSTNNNHGIGLRSASATVENCVITNCGAHGIYGDGNHNPHYAIIRDNRITNCYNAITLMLCKHCTIAENIITNNSSSGIAFTRCDCNSAIGNIIRLSGWRNVGLYWANYNVIANNDCSVIEGDSVVPSEGTIVIQSNNGVAEAISTNNVISNNVTGIGTVINNGGDGSVIATIRSIQVGTEDLEAGVSELKSGEIYLVYE